MNKINWKRTALAFVINIAVFLVLYPVLNWVWGMFANSDYVFSVAGDLKAAIEFSVFFTLIDVLLELDKAKKSSGNDKADK